MTDSELIEKLKSLIGQSIVEIHYIQTKFHYPHPKGFAQGDWTNVNPDLFVLHSPEWQLKLSNGQNVCFSAVQIREDNFASKIIIDNSTKKADNDTTLVIPNTFKWIEIFYKPITKFRLWKRLFKSSKLFNLEFNLQFQESFQIIELVCGDHKFCITSMDGDIGHTTFYPTGYLGDRLGVFIDKTVCESHTVYNLTTRMRLAYKFPK